MSRISKATGILVMLLSTAVCPRAQALQEPPLPVDPRPLAQLISDSEKATIAETHDPKKLMDAYLKISDVHLQAAFNAIKGDNHAAAERELDVYNKAIAEAGKEAFSIKEGKRAVSKRLEQTLYRQIRVLESIDRLFSAEREAFAEAALKHARQLRVEALNKAFASGDVLSDPEKKLKEEPRKESPLPPAAMNLRPVARARQISGDYLTEEEDDHVREAQAPEHRVKVFMKIADRRIKALTDPAATTPDKNDQKKVEQEDREWGAVPKVSRAELLRHYARAISECMAKLEDAYERNPKSAALPKALAVLRDSTDRQLQALRTLASQMKTESETAALRDAIEQAETANKGARDGLK
ncbi:MAG TPA: hypothetical protein VKF81_16095 [Blastocatellia bacterium]|nr:hypothetical protein [Blastocatellia bacterium]